MLQPRACIVSPSFLLSLQPTLATLAASEVTLDLKVVTKTPIELVQYQLLLVREIKRGRPKTYPGYARIKKEGPRPTILAEGILGRVRSYKGALELARGYLGRLEKGRLPAPWEEIEGIVLTRHRGYGAAKSSAGAKSDVERGPRKTKDTTEWLYYLDKQGNEVPIDPQTRKILPV